MPGLVAREVLPPANDDVDILGIELKAIADAAGSFGCNHRAAASQKTVENDVTASRAVHNGIGNHSDGLHRRMQRKKTAFFVAATEGNRRRILPHIGAVSTKLTKLDVVDMRSSTSLEHKDELMLAAIKRSHASAILCPNTQVFQPGKSFLTGREYLLDVPPVHAYVSHCSIGAVFR